MSVQLQGAVAAAGPAAVAETAGRLLLAADAAETSGDPAALLYVALTDDLLEPVPTYRVALVAAAEMVGDRVAQVVEDLLGSTGDRPGDVLPQALARELAAAAFLARGQVAAFGVQLDASDTVPSDWL